MTEKPKVMASMFNRWERGLEVVEGEDLLRHPTSGYFYFYFWDEEGWTVGPYLTLDEARTARDTDGVYLANGIISKEEL